MPVDIAKNGETYKIPYVAYATFLAANSTDICAHGVVVLCCLVENYFVVQYIWRKFACRLSAHSSHDMVMQGPYLSHCWSRSNHLTIIM